MGIERLNEIKPNMELVNKIKEVLDWRKIEYEFYEDKDDYSYNFDFTRGIILKINNIDQYITLLDLNTADYRIHGYNDEDISFSVNPMKITFFRIGGKVIYEKKKEYTFNIEELGDLLHFAWSKWMNYILNDKNELSKEIYGNLGLKIFNNDTISRWRKQMNTNYKNLTTKEQDSDKNVFMEWFKQNEGDVK
jgi:hypothetical protein